MLPSRRVHVRRIHLGWTLEVLALALGEKVGRAMTVNSLAHLLSSMDADTADHGDVDALASALAVPTRALSPKAPAGAVLAHKRIRWPDVPTPRDSLRHRLDLAAAARGTSTTAILDAITGLGSRRTLDARIGELSDRSLALTALAGLLPDAAAAQLRFEEIQRAREKVGLPLLAVPEFWWDSVKATPISTLAGLTPYIDIVAALCDRLGAKYGALIFDSTKGQDWGRADVLQAHDGLSEGFPVETGTPRRAEAVSGRGDGTLLAQVADRIVALRAMGADIPHNLPEVVADAARGDDAAIADLAELLWLDPEAFDPGAPQLSSWLMPSADEVAARAADALAIDTAAAHELARVAVADAIAQELAELDYLTHRAFLRQVDAVTVFRDGVIARLDPAVAAGNTRAAAAIAHELDAAIAMATPKVLAHVAAVAAKDAIRAADNLAEAERYRIRDAEARARDEARVAAWYAPGGGAEAAGDDLDDDLDDNGPNDDDIAEMARGVVGERLDIDADSVLADAVRHWLVEAATVARHRLVKHLGRGANLDDAGGLVAPTRIRFKADTVTDIEWGLTRSGAEVAARLGLRPETLLPGGPDPSAPVRGRPRKVAVVDGDGHCHHCGAEWPLGCGVVELKRRERAAATGALAGEYSASVVTCR